MPVLEQLEEGTAPSQDGATAWWGSADSWAAGGGGDWGTAAQEAARVLPRGHPVVHSHGFYNQGDEVTLKTVTLASLAAPDRRARGGAGRGHKLEPPWVP